MRKIGALLALTAAIGLPLAHAKAPAKQEKPQHQPEWAQEPDGFLGIKFGQSIPDAQTLPDCPMLVAHVANPRPGYLCYDGDSRSTYGSLLGLPDLGFGYRVNVMLDNSVPNSFVLGTSSDNFTALAKVLIQRYGKPSKDTVGKVQSKAGAEFDNETLQWVGKHVTITAEKRSGQVDTAQVMISDRAYWEARAKADEQTSTENASKL